LQCTALEAAIATLVVSDTEVNLAAFQQRQLFVAQSLDQPHLHIGKAFAVSRQKSRQNTFDRLRRGRHPQHSAASAPEQF